jgi:hypothetical protein
MIAVCILHASFSALRYQRHFSDAAISGCRLITPFSERIFYTAMPKRDFAIAHFI